MQTQAPGNAPIYDACGMAGGAPVWRHTALSFYDTPNNKQGDLGSKVLPPNPTGVVWRAGETVETKWNIRANHGVSFALALAFAQPCKAPSLPNPTTTNHWMLPALLHPSLTLRRLAQGGYQYRLCPLSAPLTEDCFRQRPIPFAGAAALEWQNGSRLEIKGRYLSTGTIPSGSVWARMPMPYSNPHTKPQFDPPCDELPDAWKTETGVCSGR